MRSKLNKHHILSASASLRTHLPECQRFSRSALLNMLKNHRTVYAKPDNSSLGYGVIRIENGRRYVLQSGVRRLTFTSFPALFNGLKKQMKDRPYLLQQGIELMKYGRRRFDIRIMLQKTKTENWLVTGVAARIAPIHQIVTNISAGGTVAPLSNILPATMSVKTKQQLVANCEQVAMKATKQLARNLPRLKESGVDLAIDSQHRIWILEINTRPDIKLFNRLADRTIIEKIYRLRSELVTQRG
jgi:glutathione synthase/RimK-type ligase-like ATP-grasp enzyme